MSIHVVPPSETDKLQWQSLYRGYAEFYNVPMNQDVLNTVWDWIMDGNNPFYCLLAIDGANNALGLMHFRAMPSPLRGSTVGFLDDLFVSPEKRGQGVVNALFKALDEEAVKTRLAFCALDNGGV